MGAATCPCQSGRLFRHCCGPFAESPMLSGELPLGPAKTSLRRHLLEMARVSEDMQELWFTCLDHLSESIRSHLERNPTQQALMDHFLWDWFKKYSDARPIVRVARYFDATDLRLANHLDGWGLAPWEPWVVKSYRNGLWRLEHLTSRREIEATATFEHHRWEIGDALLTRILHHAGHDFTGLHVARFPGQSGVRSMQKRWKALGERFRLTSHTRLRPDIHNEFWLALHEDLLEFILENDPKTATLDPELSLNSITVPLEDTVMVKPLPELAGQTPKQAAQNEFGRHRLRKWLETQDALGYDTRQVRHRLGIVEASR